MLLSEDHEVIALGLSWEEGVGLNVAVSDLRLALGPLDAYLATYARTGMRGPTLVLGKKLVDGSIRGRPLFAIKKVEGRHVLAFAMTPEEHRQVLQAFFKAESWRALINSVAYPLQSLAADSVAFASKMKTLGKKLKKEHAEFYALRVGGDSLMPSDYRSQEHSIEEGTQLVQDLDELSSVAAPTTRERLIDARLGQGRFRREVLARWGGGLRRYRLHAGGRTPSITCAAVGTRGRRNSAVGRCRRAAAGPRQRSAAGSDA